VSSLNQEGFSTCTVTAGTNATPERINQNVWMQCGDKLISVSKQSKNGAKPVTSIYEQLGVMREEAIEYEARTINYPSNFLSVGLPGCTDCSRLAKEEYWMISLRRHDDSFARCRS
jgi:hypothetical protein